MKLPVVQPDLPPDVAGGLAHRIRGEVRTGRHDRLLYATDASLYQVEPLAVVIPASTDDIETVVAYAGEHGLPILARGGGTSLAGQCTNRAIVIDTSSRCRGVRDLNVDDRTCIAEAGVNIDELNETPSLVGAGLFFAPDPATARQATVGGCVGNNAAGARSIRYGRTSENVAGVEVVTVGEGGCRRLWLAPGAGRDDPGALRLGEGVIDITRRHADLVRERFPKTIRRNAGYGLDLILRQLDDGATAETIDLSGLMCGSEGTLAVTLGARLKLHAVPSEKALAVIAFDSVEAALAAVQPILTTNPTAVELLDDCVLDAARGNVEYRSYVDLLPRPDAAAVLYVEYFSTGDDPDGVERGTRALGEVLPGAHAAVHRDASSMLSAWKLRKAGEPLLHGLSATRKPISFVEDNAVPVERLEEFVARFKEIVARHGTRAAYWAHASVGVLHIRPMIDLHDPEDLAVMRSIAVEAADLARACGGVMSGEHGDGRVRGPLLERFFGPELMGAFREVKALFDPAGILNPGNIVGGAPIESMTERLRVRPEGPMRPVPDVETYYDYQDHEGFGGAVEMCNGAGVCRKRSGGTMCPSYMAMMDERHTTRGRANALRLAITGQSDPASGRPAWDDGETIETLDLCLSCKACKSECPSNVDLARLKAEYTAQRFRQRGGAGVRTRFLANPRPINRLGSSFAPLANWVNGLGLTRAVVNRLLGFAPERSLPRFERSLLRWFNGRRSPAVSADAPVVLFYPDCFTVYNESRIGIASIEVLEALGYRVEIPDVGCCGRAQISTGMLADAIQSADAALAGLTRRLADPGVVGIVVCEPSCLSAINDDWLSLKCRTPAEERERVARRAWLVEDFIESRWDQHPVPPAVAGTDVDVILHAHCHQKALWGAETSARLLRRLVGDRLTVLDSGCCGMAGGFGYARHRYELSMAIGELVLLPGVREAADDAVICASGTSCRHQVHDGAGRRAVHPIEYAASRLIAR